MIMKNISFIHKSLNYWVIIKLWFLITCILFIGTENLKAQETYTENGGELIFSFADVIYNGYDIPAKMRFSMFFHFGSFRHFDFNNNFGFYTGLGLRNVGFRNKFDEYKETRRVYSLGIPASFKIGSFNRNYYFYSGAEGELFFHYKQKRKFSNSKLKYSEWFSNRTRRLMPSLFLGLQLPGGVNIKFKYYPQDFLNKNFVGTDFGQAVNYSDFEKTKLFYFALTYTIRTRDLKKLNNPDSRNVILAKMN